MAEKYNIVVALQGGGSHGAFAWGVLDRILEDERFVIKGISGTSAGGMNAASAIQGLLQGSRDKAKELLNSYWEKISEMSAKMRMEKFEKTEDLDFLSDTQKIFNLENNIYQKLTGSIVEMLSPYQFNPLDKNPLKDFMESFFDFELFRKNDHHKIFLGATHVKSGRIKIFSNSDMCADVLLASACLPQLFQTVSVDGEEYWDGGFIANPAIYPLMSFGIPDILVVQLTKTYCEEIPHSKEEITNRLKEITYNGCLVREMRAIHFISKMIDDGLIKENALTRFNMHLLKDESAFKNLTLKSAMNPHWEFITALKAEGRKTAEKWINDYVSKTPEQRQESCLKSFEHFIS